MFITFEGIDGSGKSTQIQLLADKLRDMGHQVKVLREPGGNTLSEQIRALLLTTSETVDIRCELLLFLAARAQLTGTVIKPALEKNIIVLCDRYTDSSVAYQGYGRGLSVQDIDFCNKVATDTLIPDATFVLDISTDSAADRASSREQDKDRMERSGQDFFQRVRDGYKAIAENNPDRVVLLSATQSKQELHEQIWQVIISLPAFPGK
jgi:dTMP kinase